MVDAVGLWGATICQQSISSLESHIAREHLAVGHSKHTEVTEQARWQKRRRSLRNEPSFRVGSLRDGAVDNFSLG